MGSRVVAAVHKQENMELMGGLEADVNVGRDIGEAAGLGNIGIKVSGDLEEIVDRADVLVEFTDPEASLGHLRDVVKHNKAMVLGTTGFSEGQMREIKELTKNIPCVMAPNMSVGINVLLKVVADLAKWLGDEYDIEIVETHHRFKKDAPSGTAKRIAQVLASAYGRDLGEVGVYGRQGMIGERSRDEIGILAIRAGDTVGDHTVIFGGIGERLEITHRAHSRDTFAYGAIRAIRFVTSARKGLYDMQDVLGIKE